MTYYRDMLIGNKVVNAPEILEMVKRGNQFPEIYFICIGENENYMMEIMRTTRIFKKINKKNNYLVIGIADGREEAFNIAGEIIKRWIDIHSGINIREFKNFFRAGENENDKE